MINENELKEKAKRWLRYFEKEYKEFNLKAIKPYADDKVTGALFNYEEVFGKDKERLSTDDIGNFKKIVCHYAWIKYFFGVE